MAFWRRWLSRNAGGQRCLVQLSADPLGGGARMPEQSTPRDFHERAAKSSFEARGRAMTLSAAGIAGLFALLTKDGFTASTLDKALLILSGLFLAGSIGAGVFNAYADAQWSYYRGVLADFVDKRTPRAEERRWHAYKGRSELVTQLSFVFGVVAAAALLLRLVLDLPSSACE